MDDKQICQWTKNKEDMKWSALKWGLGLEEGSFSLMEKAMATHSSTLAWKIPRMEEPDGLQSMGPTRVEHD